MAKRLSIDELKKQYIGQTFNWLTVLDVYRENSILYFKCRCKCGIETCIPKKQVLSGNNVSCGCYKRSKELGNKIKHSLIAKAENNRAQKISQLKHEYIGKTFNYLTIIDISHEDNCDKCLCKCRCGKEKQISLYRVIKGFTKSCGCINRETQKEYWSLHKDQRAEAAKKYSQWCKDNPDKVKEKANKRLIYYREHPNELSIIGRKISQWCKDNPDKLKEQVYKYKQWCINNRDLSKSRARNSRLANIKDRSYLIEFKDIIHPDDYKALMNNESTTCRTKCPVCGRYEEHSFNNTFQNSKLKRNSPPKCIGCRSIITSSKAEQELADYISTIYSGKLIRNSREIISPLELDIYIPEKKIAIEFNGDYWHSSKFKETDYHYNKYLQCREKGILLVSVFESAWNDYKDRIKSYIRDFLNGIENKLSFNEDHTVMNNNYPSPVDYATGSFIEDYYVFNDDKVFTCGFSLVNKSGVTIK